MMMINYLTEERVSKLSPEERSIVHKTLVATLQLISEDTKILAMVLDNKTISLEDVNHIITIANFTQSLLSKYTSKTPATKKD